MGSQHLYRSYAEYFLGRPPASQEEMDQMNLRIQGSPTHTWITTGYDQRFIQQCVPALAFFKGLCLAGLGSEQTNLNPVRKWIVSESQWSPRRPPLTTVTAIKRSRLKFLYLQEERWTRWYGRTTKLRHFLRGASLDIRMTGSYSPCIRPWRERLWRKSSKWSSNSVSTLHTPLELDTNF